MLQVAWSTIFCVLFSYQRVCYSMVDVYLSKEEMKRLFDKEAQLDYVTDGKVNVYAVNYTIPMFVSWNITQLYFYWKSYSSNDVFYTLDVTADKPGLLFEPFLSNYPSKGVIPKQDKGFSINIKCLRVENVVVSVFIDITYTWPSVINKTQLRLIRKKFCSPNASLLTEHNLIATALPTKDADRSNVKKHFPNASRTESAAFYYGSFGAAGNIFYVAIGCVFGFIIVVASLVVLYFARKKPQGYELTSSAIEQTSNSGPVSRVFPMEVHENYRARYPSQSSASKYSSYSNGGTGTSVSLWKSNGADSSSVIGAVLKFEPKEVDVNYLLEKLVVDRNRIHPMRLEIEGTFGELFSGYLAEEDDEAEDVIIKTVKIGGASELQIMKFLNESFAFSCLPPHQNVACVLAACDSGPEDLTPILCYSHRGYGNLKKFLTKCRGAEASHSLVTQDLVHMALQIIRGIMHLHQNKILHRDIATRNCLIAEDLTVQIYDTGLSRDLFPQDYHCLGDNENRPVKWMAVEALERREFSSASDVWSFGVTLWELITLAQQPYADVDPFEMHTWLMEGQRLVQPYNCPDEMFMLMYCCWNNHAEARPTFMNLLKALEHFYAQLNQYI